MKLQFLLQLAGVSPNSARKA